MRGCGFAEAYELQLLLFFGLFLPVAPGDPGHDGPQHVERSMTVAGKVTWMFLLWSPLTTDVNSY